MYVALKELIEAKAEGGFRRVFPGEEVLTFTQWPLQNQISALSARVVREAPASPEPLAQTLVGASEPKDVREATERAFARALDDSRAALQPAAGDPPAPAGAPAAVASSPNLTCEECGYVANTEHGLRIHFGREHKKG